MEFTSGVRGVSPGQDPSRWEPHVALWRGQRDLYELLWSTQKTRYAVQAPTGYGKTWMVCIAHAVLRDQQRITRTLVIVPTTTQNDQYVGTAAQGGITEDLHTLGIPYVGIEWCDGGTRAIRSHRQNTAAIFITNVHKIISDPGFFADLCSTGAWLIVADEHHHYAADRSWGKAIQQLNFTVLLGLSATPVRADKQQTVLNGANDIVITVEDAIHREHAIRPIKAHVSNYFVDIVKGDADTPVRFSLDRLAEEAAGQEISEWEAQKKIRYNGTYLAQILTEALNCLQAKNAVHPCEHQVLVFTMSCKHAAHVAAQINAAVQEDGFAQWIGVGPNGRDETTNTAILERFQTKTFPCLVQVNKAGEGFNNKRCSVAVFLNLIGDTPMARQQLGRAMRRNTALPWRQDVADIFASSDAKIVSLLKSYEEATQPDEEQRALLDDDASGCDTTPLRLWRIPDLFVLDVEYIATTLCYPFGTLEASVEALRPQVTQQYGFYPTDEQVKAALIAILAEKQRPAQASPKLRFKAVKDSVKGAVGTLAANALRCLYGPIFTNQQLGQACQAINARWVYTTGVRQKDLTEEELRAKYTWVQEVNTAIQETREVPVWLHI
jgi:superfamily II DNA or RNA helicase